jgi:hypothetical protein
VTSPHGHGIGTRAVRPYDAVGRSSRRSDSNRRPAVYKTAALPLSYAGVDDLRKRSKRLTHTAPTAEEIMDASVGIAGSVGDIEVLAASFTRYLRAANRSPKTIRTYAEAVEGLDRFLTDHGMPRQVSAIRREHVEAFVEDILARWTAATALNRYQGLRQSFRFLTEDGEITDSPMDRMTPPKVPEAPPPVLTDDELRALLKAADGNTFEQRRRRSRSQSSKGVRLGAG